MNNKEVGPLVEKFVDFYRSNLKKSDFFLTDLNFAAKELNSFCRVEIHTDYECFKMATNRGKFHTILEPWDTNKDGKVSLAELKKAIESMNLGRVKAVSHLEVEAYFSRNKYLVCRPYAKKVMQDFDKELEHLVKFDRPAYFENFFDKMVWNGTVTSNKTVSFEELSLNMASLCTNELKIKQMNKKGKKYYPNTDTESLITTDFFIKKSKKQLSESILSSLPQLCKNPWTLEL